MLAWAHGTVGIADRCAPSWNGRSARDIEYLTSWLAEGFAIVASDYEGLGTDGPHPYKNVVSEARSVIDSARATIAARDDLSGRWAVVGRSQGGGAALATGAFESSYGEDASELIGTLATAPSPPAAILLLRVRTDTPSASLGFVPLQLRSLEVTEPGFDPTQYLTELGRELLERADTDCYLDIARWVLATGITGAEALAEEAPDPRPLGEEHFDPPASGYDEPVLIAQGGADTTVPIGLTDVQVREMCAAGADVRYLTYPGEDHSSNLLRSRADTVPWVRSLFAGSPPPGNCPG